LNTTSAASPEDAPCAGCHVEVCETFDKMPHGIALSNTLQGDKVVCESCHGSGAAHAASGDPAQIINPAKQNELGETDMCLSCHNGPTFDDWPFAQHRSSAGGCASCHQVHASARPSKSEDRNNSDMCYRCHAGIRAEMSMPSHHPVAEGKLICTDCHNPHGGEAPLAQGATSRELCISCHAEKEGPFMYEHAPVNEDCQVCHSPHGTVADNLLKQTEPTLCLSCHSMHFHATVEGADGAFTVPLDPSRNGMSTPDGWKTGMLTKCTQCHGAIHGTDLPSQALSTGGNALTR
jgi:DmsE family decaheme c-type cytochrome